MQSNNKNNKSQNEKIIIKGASFGILIGTVLGVLTDNIALWLSLGLAIGAGVGMSIIEKQNKEKSKSKES